MKKLIIITLLLLACAPLSNLGLLPTAEPLPTHTPYATFTALAEYPTYTPYPSYTPLSTHTPLSSHTPIPTQPPTQPLSTLTPYPSFTPVPSLVPYATATPVVYASPVPSETSSLPQDGFYVKVTRFKTVLRQIKNYNKKGYPIMRIREPRLRYDQGELIFVHATGGNYDDGPLWRADGVEFYYKVYDPDGSEEDLFVPSWHVEIIPVN